MSLLVAVQVAAQQPPAQAAVVAAAPTERFIVKLRASSDAAAQAAPARVAALIARHGLTVMEVRHIVSGIHLVLLQALVGAETQGQTLARLRANPQVEYAEVDQRRYLNAEPDDPLFANQWYLQAAQASAVDAIDAWNMTTGSPGLVIADLDTGVRFDHPDLRNTSANRLLPGYNLISNASMANNGYGRGPDASDPGDWVSTSDLKNPVFAKCTVANSSWHGTRVAGVLGALTNNETGVAGMTWQGWIEPVRVLGKCGGYDSDIIAGMAWAAGNPLEGVPDNPYPARIINMSLGAPGACPLAYQQMVNQLLSEGVLVVVSAGNEGGPVDAPANCIGVAAVAGLREVGTKVGYSSLGPQISLGAPAGNCVNTGAGEPCQFSIDTTTNSGTTIPATNTYTDAYNYNVGTSFSAPQVSAIAGLMLSVNGNLTPEQLIARLKTATVPYPVSTDPEVPVCHVPADASDLQTSECSCTTAACGAGMANANNAVLGALRPIAAVQLEFAGGSNVSLDASGSAAACNATIASYQWTVVQPSSHPPVVQNANSAKASIATPPPGATYTLMLTVSDSEGRSDTATVTLTYMTASTTATQAAGTDACLTAVSYTVGQASGTAAGGATTTSSTGSGGGGGGLDGWTLLTLGAGALVLARTRCYSSRCAASSHSRCARR